MIDPLRFRSQLATEFCGHHLLQFSCIDSSNRVLMDWSRRSPDSPEGLTVIATQQTEGQGSRGHQWVSTPGGLYMSVLLYPQAQVSQVLELTLAIAWGVALSLRRELGLDVQVKWPNDLVIQGQKLGGILLKSRSTGGKAESLVAGLGLNVLNPAPEMGVSISDCVERELAMSDVAAIALGGLEVGYLQWQVAGLDGLQAAYESLMAFRNGEVLCDFETAGRVTGITVAGQLRVEVEGEERLYQPGEIQLGYRNDL